MWERGHLVFGRALGARLRAHFSLPLGAVLFGGFGWAPGAWVGFVAVVVAHELGHVALARALRLRVTEVTLHAAGGECWIVGRPSALSRATVAWGGVLAQVALCVVASYAAELLHPTGFGAAFVDALQAPNLLLAAFNLLPIGPLDGREAWRIVPELLRRAFPPAAPPARRAAPLAPVARVAPFKLTEARRDMRELGAGAQRRAAEQELMRYAESVLRRRKPSKDRSTLN